MARKRMFDMEIIDTDLFLEMPIGAQNLYFHLGMRADDDGFVSNPRKIQKLIGSNEDDLKILIAKQFIIPFETGIIVIRHWKLNNYLRKDRYTPTIYTCEKALLQEDSNGVYSLGIPSGIPNDNQMTTIGLHSIEKKRIEEKRIEENNILSVSDENEPCESTPRAEEITEIVDYLNNRVGTKYRPNSKETKKHINARLEEGFTVEQFKEVIDKKANQWIGTEMEQYLRPSTLFGTKFESYLNAYVNPTQTKQNATKEKVTFADLFKEGYLNDEE
jgi:uncharacterized phage protein (TIGR02220 family)